MQKNHNKQHLQGESLKVTPAIQLVGKREGWDETLGLLPATLGLLRFCRQDLLLPSLKTTPRPTHSSWVDGHAVVLQDTSELHPGIYSGRCFVPFPTAATCVPAH